eukprot:jgi/Hompol1/701/HPOL_000440-RA
MQGQPPASQEAIDTQLRPVTVDEQFKRKRGVESCPVCLEMLDGDSLVAEMPCHHLYHRDCIVRWFKESNMCPTCRYEVMTDNPEFNETVKQRMAQRRSTDYRSNDCDHTPDTSSDRDSVYDLHESKS